jgi:hypothetical protein
MKKFKEGDKVWDITRGNGIVVDFDSQHDQPVVVHFEKRLNEFYLEDGKVFEDDINPSLYHGHDLKIEVKK